MVYRIIILTIFCISCSTTSPEYIVEIDTYRTKYKNEFNESSHAPLKGNQLDSMRFFKANHKFKILADSERIENGKILQIPTSSGMIKEFRPYAKLTFKVKGKKEELTVYQNLKTIQMPQYRDYLFLPFTDETNGESTYGGGRYIDLRIGDFQGEKLWLDFNKAYNPYCHYSSGYNCPIPPSENDLDLRIEAGEKNYVGQYIGTH